MGKKIYNQDVFRSNLEYLLNTTDATMSDMDSKGVATKGYISNYLKDNDRLLGNEILEKISNYFNVELEVLLNIDLATNNKQNANVFNNVNVEKEPAVKYNINEDDKYVHEIPLYESSVSAGIPKMIFDNPKAKIDLGLVKKGCFAIRVNGDSMEDFDIKNNDIVVVYPTKEVMLNKIVVVRVEDSFTVKKLVEEDGKRLLMPGNKKYKPIVLDEDSEMVGVVLHSIREYAFD